jgi:hypothetical protein
MRGEQHECNQHTFMLGAPLVFVVESFQDATTKHGLGLFRNFSIFFYYFLIFIKINPFFAQYLKKLGIF